MILLGSNSLYISKDVAEIKQFALSLGVLLVCLCDGVVEWEDALGGRDCDMERMVLTPQ